MNFSEAELKALAEVARVLDGVDFVLIGAAALREFGHCQWRSTLDLDFTVALDGDAFPGPLEGSMLRHDARLEHRWYSAGVSLDILPAGPRLIEQGFIRWGDKTMNLTGMRLALAHAVPRHLAPGLVIRVAPPAVITVLKMVAYCDRPAERERDLGDLAHLLEDYVGDNDDRRFEDRVAAANLDWDHVSAHELGMDVAGIITAAELPSIESFLSWHAVATRRALWLDCCACRASLAMNASNASWGNSMRFDEDCSRHDSSDEHRASYNRWPSQCDRPCLRPRTLDQDAWRDEGGACDCLCMRGIYIRLRMHVLRPGRRRAASTCLSNS